MEFRADLHIHTLLSSCAELEMLPSLIVLAAEQANIDLIAVCDHNSAENAEAVVVAAANSGVKVLPGMEVQTLEGIHVLCIFEDIDAAVRLQRSVYDALPGKMISEEKAQEQIVVDGFDQLLDLCRRPLQMPTMLDLDTLTKSAHDLGAVVVPSHVDKHGSGLLDVLGFLPEETEFDAFELSANITAEDAVCRFPGLRQRTLIGSSDAHWLGAIGNRYTLLEMQHRNLDQLRQALQQGRARVA